MAGDSVADLNGVMEFNVPASDASGNVVMAAPQDQFPINTSSFVWHYDGEGQGIGKDYGILLVNANTGTGERPHVGRGFYRLSQSVPAAGTTLYCIVTDCPTTEGSGVSEVMAVLLGIPLTECGSDAEVLPLKLPSPA